MMFIKLEDYDLHCVLGCDADFSYLMKSKLNNQLLVWKPIDTGLNEESKKVIVCDLKLLVQVNHPNVVKYHNCLLTMDKKLYTVSEWYQGVDLSTIIKRHIRPLTEEFIWRVMYQVSKAVQVCRTKLKDLTVLSFEIKPENLFVDCKNNVKLGNFKLAENKNSKSLLRVGTSKNSKQEVENHTCSDVCYLGRLVYQMCTLSPSFNNGVDLCFAKTEIDKCVEIPSFYSNDLRHLVSMMFSAKKNNLTNIDFILYHPTVIRSAVPPVPQVKDVFEDLNVPRNDENKENGTLKRKWFEKVSAIRAKESELKLREMKLDIQEKALLEKEKRIKLIYLDVDEKVKQAKTHYETKKFQLHQYNIETDSKSGANNNNANTRPTIVKSDFNQLSKPNFQIKKINANEGKSTKVNVTSEAETWSECLKRHRQAILLQQTDKILVKTKFQHDDTFKITKFS